MLREHYRRRARLALVPEDVAAAEAAAVVQLRDTSPEGLVPAPSAAPAQANLTAAPRVVAAALDLHTSVVRSLARYQRLLEEREATSSCSTWTTTGASSTERGSTRCAGVAEAASRALMWNGLSRCARW